MAKHDKEKKDKVDPRVDDLERGPKDVGVEPASKQPPAEETGEVVPQDTAGPIAPVKDESPKAPQDPPPAPGESGYIEPGKPGK